MSVDRWVSIGTIGGSVWVSSVSVVGVGQPWLGFRVSFGFSLADEVSSTIGGVWDGVSGISSTIDSWGSSIGTSISTIGGSVWVSVVSIGQPWLGIRFGVSGSLSQVSVSSSVTVISSSVYTSV